jgi:N-acetylglucosamine-6-phosphate deacetylase
MQMAYSANQVFTGHQWLEDHAVVVKDGAIEDVIPLSQLRGNIKHQRYPNDILVPALIDVQVYGAAQKLFSVFPEPGTLQVMHEKFAQEGTCLFQPTLATNTIEVFKKCIDAVRAYWKQGGKGVHGLHLEGPWLNPEKRGAHIRELMRVPTKESVKELLDYGKDVITMITLAPELCSDEVIELILSYNIVISAGHSNATYQQATQSFNRGISTVTHLYNAMSPLHHREPGLVGATLNHDKVRSSIIPDGHHVDFAAIAIAKKAMGERLFAITDAVTETTSGPYQHYLAGDKYESGGTLSGSAISMHQAFYNLVHYVGMDVGEAIRMCSLYPAQALDIGHRYGKIAPHYAGQFLVLNKQLKLVGVLNGSSGC